MTTNNTYTPYRSMRAALMNLRNFRGSSVTAILNNNIYTVKSYQTVMLSLDTQTGTVLFNNRYYLFLKNCSPAGVKGIPRTFSMSD
jgi:hypothetical protein